MDTSYDTPTGTPSAPGDPTWEVAHLFPSQGDWTEGEFLALPTPHRFELSAGRLEALPMPTWFYALIGLFVLDRLREYLKQNDVGLAVPAPLFVRLWPKEIRQPDVVFCFHEHIHDRKKVQDGADLVVEVVSAGEENRRRDLEKKRALYAQAGIQEYWIVDPEPGAITVLSLENSVYRVAGEYPAGAVAASVLLPGFTVDVREALAAGEK